MTRTARPRNPKKAEFDLRFVLGEWRKVYPLAVPPSLPSNDLLSRRGGDCKRLTPSGVDAAASGVQSYSFRTTKTRGMNRINSAVLTISAVLFGVLLAGEGVGQTGSNFKKKLIGTWRLVSNYTEREDGTKFDTFGPNPIGIIGLDADGRMFLQEMRSDLPKFASNSPQQGTAVENKAIVQGSISYFGTYRLTRGQRR